MRASVVIPAALFVLAGCHEPVPVEPNFANGRPPDHFYIEQPLVLEFSCGSFNLRFEGVESERNIGLFDDEGNLVEVRGLYRRDGTYTNLTTGESVPLKMVIRFVASFGAEVTVHTENGLFARLKLDQPVRDVGRFIVIGETGEFLFRVGREDIGLENPIFPLACEELS